MADAFSYPTIDPNTFDLIVVGTGLPESILAAAASAAGKTVLHLDSNSFYGSHFASLPLHELTSFLSKHSTPPSQEVLPSAAVDGLDYDVVDLTSRPLYSDFEVSSYAPDVLEEHSRKFNIDLAGPRVLFCADKCIDLILKSGASQYLEFKSIDGNYLGGENGKLASVPDSRSAIFKDRSLGLTEKNQLMRFFKLVQQHLYPGEDSENSKISDEDLDSPFVEFLEKMRLPPKIKSIILYAISMADYDQEDKEYCKDVIQTREGVDRLALYNKSVGRFPNAPGALIYPIYGQGELSQAFCRRAAVKGCLYVLRMPVIALLRDKNSGQYKGVKLASGQDIFSTRLVLDPSFKVPPQFAVAFSNLARQNLQPPRVEAAVKGKVARGICIITQPLVKDERNSIVVYPPRSLFPGQVTSVRVLQIGANLAVCPSGMFVLYFSALCGDATEGKELLQATMNTVLSSLSSENGNSYGEKNDDAEDSKPALLWRAFYIQELRSSELGSITSAPPPDEKLNYNDLLDATMKLFQEMYPNAEFFPESSSPEDPEDNGELDLES